jgi:hypothetical protein
MEGGLWHYRITHPRWTKDLVFWTGMRVGLIIGNCGKNCVEVTVMSSCDGNTHVGIVVPSIR